MAIIITGTVVNPQAVKFIDFFTSKYPVERDVHFQFEDAEKLRCKGMDANAICRWTEAPEPLKIRIAARGGLKNKVMGLRWNFNTLAHEYRHAQQAAEGLVYKGRYDGKLEADAIDFANRMTDAAIEEGVIELTQDY